MSLTAQTIANAERAYESSLDIEALERARVQMTPFPYLIVPGFVRASALPAIGRDFPGIDHPGSFPLSTLRFGPAFASFASDLTSPQMTAVVGRKLDMDLS